MPYPIIVYIKDEEGDLIPGSTELYGIKNTIIGYAFTHHVSIHLDYDASTNEEIKIIQHNPFYFVKEVDKTSPVLNQYLATQDKLKEVEILYFMHDGSGFEKEYYNIRLENVIIIKNKVFQKMTFLEKNEPYRLMEQVGLSYKSIWWEHKSILSSIMAMHDVSRPLKKEEYQGLSLDDDYIREQAEKRGIDPFDLKNELKSDLLVRREFEEFRKPKPFIELQYQYTDGEPLDVPYRVTFEGGRVYKGRLDKNGYKKIESVPDEHCEVIYGDQDEVDKLLGLKQELQVTLDDMVEEVQAESKILEKTLQEYGYLAQGMIYTGAFLSGLYGAGKDTVNGLYDAGKFTYDTMLSADDAYSEIKRSIYNAIINGDLEAVRQKIGVIAAEGEAALETAQEIYETCELVLSDNNMRMMITRFAEKYFKNLHSTQKAEMLGSLSLDIVITLLTSGAGTAASFIGKSRHFRKATGLISDITVMLKKRRQIKKFDGTLNKINPKKLKRKEIGVIEKYKPVKKPEPAKKKVTNVPKMKIHTPKCFKPGDSLKKTFKGKEKKMEMEFLDQLSGQEKGLNKLTVGEYNANRELFKKYGRKGTGKAQTLTRKKYEKDTYNSIIDELSEKGISKKEAAKIAEKQTKRIMKSMAALHEPDLNAGGYDDTKKMRMGNTSVNSSLGSQWQHKVKEMDKAAINAERIYGPNAKMNIKLERCN